MTSRREDELTALLAIYDGNDSGLEISVISGEGDTGIEISVHVRVRGAINATFFLPQAYPETEYPVLSISIGGAETTFEHAKQMKFLSSELELLLEAELGNEVLFPAIELIRTKVSDLKDSSTIEVPIAPSGSLDVEMPPLTTSLTIYHSQPLVEKKSVFISHFAIVSSMDHVREFRAVVLSDKKIARATHNIFCYRFTCSKTNIVYHDCDDDGESAAGSRLGEMIRLMGLEQGVAVIVSRWFGGVLLGPDRFKLICNSARNLLEEQLGRKAQG